MRRFTVGAVILVVTMLVAASTAIAAVTPTLVTLTSDQPGWLRVLIHNTDPTFGYNAVRCQDNADPIADQANWMRWPSNFAEEDANGDVAATTSEFQNGSMFVQGHEYSCYATEVGQDNSLSGRSNVLTATVMSADPTPTPTPTPSPSPTPTPPPGACPPLSSELLYCEDFEDTQANDSVTPAGRRNASASTVLSRFGMKDIRHDDSDVACTVSSDSTLAFNGSKSMRIRIGPTTADGDTEDPGRCQPTANTANVGANQDRWYGFSVYLRNDALLGSVWNTSQMANNGQTFLGLDGFRYTSTSNNGPGGNIGPAENGVWFSGFSPNGGVGNFPNGRRALNSVSSNIDTWCRYLQHITWSTVGGTNGLYDTWVSCNGGPYVQYGTTYHGLTLYSSSASRRHGYYGGRAVTQTRIENEDDLRIGTTEAAVR